MPVEKQVAILYAVTQNILTELPADRMSAYEQGLYDRLDQDPDGAAVMDAVRRTGKLEADMEETLRKILETYTGEFLAER